MMYQVVKQMNTPQTKRIQDLYRSSKAEKHHKVRRVKLSLRLHSGQIANCHNADKQSCSTPES